MIFKVGNLIRFHRDTDDKIYKHHQKLHNRRAHFRSERSDRENQTLVTAARLPLVIFDGVRHIYEHNSIEALTESHNAVA